MSWPRNRSGRIGIGVTTHNRPEALRQCLEQIDKFRPVDSYLVVVDDASDNTDFEGFRSPGQYYRFEENVGVARAKNKCIEMLMDAECDHLFLFDDDCWPISEVWYSRYIHGGEPHLMYLFKDLDPRRNGEKLDTPPTTWSNGRVYAQHWPRGCMMYLHYTVVERVGGMRPDFGRWGHEHVEYSWRIHNAGLTTAPFMDVVDSHKWIYSADEHIHTPEAEHRFERTVPYAQRTAAVVNNQKILQKYAYSDDFVEYRSFPNAVISTLLTAKVDPQRGTRMIPSYEKIAKWCESIRGAEKALLVDDDRGLVFPPEMAKPDGLRIASKPSQWHAYGQRWLRINDWLRHNRYEWVWITDATDVEMLQEPWPHMRSNTLYVGYEPTVLGGMWMLDNHPGYRQWIIENSGRQLFNAGVVGGDYKTVRRFVSGMVRELLEVAAQTGEEPMSDMGSFNKVVAHWQESGRNVEWGSRWTTVFKGEERNTWSIWKHK
ncbi:glycosyltransferase [Mycobacterium phage ScoobyDoobyDoo]|nr:glycosyltransferase [Mycobacterium phage ScoobyDoobyDoo]